MISKSKLGAAAFVAAIALASPALVAAAPIGNGPVGAPGSAVTPVANYGAQNYAPSQTGGGSAGYNHNLSTDYRLKHHKNSKTHAQQ